MRILAYTDQRYAVATRQVVGVGATILTSPPLYAADVSASMLQGYDLIYIDLHGDPGSVYLYSGKPALQAALKLDTVLGSNLTGCVVLATTCYLPQTKFIEAFLNAGARAVIAGDGENYGDRTRLSGAQVLAHKFIECYTGNAGTALEWAKQSMQSSLWARFFQRKATADALQFRLFQIGKGGVI